MSNTDLQDIYDTALRLLAELGMGEVPARLAEKLIAAGGTDHGAGRILFSRALVEDAIAKAAKTFVLYGRDEERSIEVGGDKVYFGTGGAAILTLDIDSGLYRPSTLHDLHDFTRLQDTFANVSWYTRCCVATDVPDAFDLDINTAKPTASSFTLANHVDPIVQMFDIAAGGDGAFARRPFVKAHISPVISPMRYVEDAVACCI